MHERYRIGATSFENVTCAGATGAFCAIAAVEPMTTAAAMAASLTTADLKSGTRRMMELTANLPVLCKLRSEDRERIERRAGAFLDQQRRGREHELVAVQPSGGLDRPLEIEVVEDVDAERDERELMDRKTDRRRQGRRRDVVPFVGADERHAAVLEEEGDVGVRAGH